MNKLLPLFIFLATAATAQKPLYAVFRNYTTETVVLNDKGKVVFTLPAGHEPVVDREFAEWKADTKRTITLFDNMPVCAVLTREDTVYLIDRNGNTVRNLEKQYAHIYAPSEGFMRAYTRVPGSDLRLVYLDHKGDVAFGKDFFTGGPFREGKAIVRVNAFREWSVLTTTGEQIAIDPQIAGKIAWASPFNNGLAAVTLEDTRGTQKNVCWIDGNGKIIIDSRTLLGENTSVKDQSNTDHVISVLPKVNGLPRLIMLDAQGKQLATLDSVARINPFVNSHAYILRYKPELDHVIEQWVWINKQGREVQLTIKDFNTNYTLRHSNRTRYYDNQYMQVAAFRHRDKQTVDLLLSPTAKKITYETTGTILGVAGNKLLVRDSIDRFIQLPGRVLWQTPLEEIVFTNITDALKVKDRVRHFRVTTDDIPPELSRLIKLEELIIEQPVSNIGVLASLINLKRLTLLNAEALTAFPEIKLPQLKWLYVKGAASGIGLEAFIGHNTTLQEATLVNCTLDPEFE